MHKIRELLQLLIAFMIIAGFIAVVMVVSDSLGVLDTFRAQQQVRASEARARELEAEANALRARQALITTWVLSFASTKDSLLVLVTYIGGGIALVSTLIIIGLLLHERGGKHYEQHY